MNRFLIILAMIVIPVALIIGYMLHGIEGIINVLSAILIGVSMGTLFGWVLSKDEE